MRAKLAVVFAAAAFAIGGFALSQTVLGGKSTASAPIPGVPTPPQLLVRPVPPTAPNAQLAERGRYLTIIGDCVSCHTRPDGAPFAGGLGINTPFGVIYSPNLTSAAMKDWTPDQFWNALHTGHDDQNVNLYPAFPYTYFTRVSRADSDAILAYLKTTPAVDYSPPRNGLPFPLNIRFMMKGWNLLFFHPQGFRPNPSKSAEWNRGAYIVTGLGHCGACHTPKNMLGADKNDKALQGGSLDQWLAPDLTGNFRSGLGSWSVSDVVEYLKTGRNAHSQAGGPMAEVVSYSTSLMSDADLMAIAVYLKDQVASPQSAVPQPDQGAMRAGHQVYVDACASCHLLNGVGVPRFFPRLRGDPNIQQRDPTSVEHVILIGARTAPTPTAPTPLSMPSFAWKLTDQQIADVSTYIRNSWGNAAPAVSAGQVAKMRRKTHVGDGYPSTWSAKGR